DATSADFVPIEPLPYATFADIRREAWLGLLRAEVCATLEVSPEQVLPQRVVRELKAKLQDGRPARLAAALRGYRNPPLGDALEPEVVRAELEQLAENELAVLIQSSVFRIPEFRIRVELYRRNVKVMEHSNLERIEDGEVEHYVAALAYDPAYYRELGHALK